MGSVNVIGRVHELSASKITCTVAIKAFKPWPLTPIFETTYAVAILLCDLISKRTLFETTYAVAIERYPRSSSALIFETTYAVAIY